MPISSPPEPPAVEQPDRRSGAPIVDMRDAFARKGPQTGDDRARSRAFVEGKIEMICRDPRLTDEQKAAAIADLKAKL